MVETYKVKVTCNNCGYEGEAVIPKGVTIRAELSRLGCDRCGCMQLSKKVEKPITCVDIDYSQPIPYYYPYYLSQPYPDYTYPHTICGNPAYDQR